jgi:hypothetical protein
VRRFNGWTGKSQGTVNYQRIPAQRLLLPKPPVWRTGIGLRRVYTLLQSLDAADNGSGGGANAATYDLPSDVVNAHRLDRFGFVPIWIHTVNSQKRASFFGGENDGVTFPGDNNGLNDHVDRVPASFKQKLAAADDARKKWRQ